MDFKTIAIGNLWRNVYHGSVICRNGLLIRKTFGLHHIPPSTTLWDSLKTSYHTQEWTSGVQHGWLDSIASLKPTKLARYLKSHHTMSHPILNSMSMTWLARYHSLIKPYKTGLYDDKCFLLINKCSKHQEQSMCDSISKPNSTLQNQLVQGRFWDFGGLGRTYNLGPN